MTAEQLATLCAKIGRAYIVSASNPDKCGTHVLILDDSLELGLLPREKTETIDDTNKLAIIDKANICYCETEDVYFLDGILTSRILHRVSAILVRNNDKPLTVAQYAGIVCGVKLSYDVESFASVRREDLNYAYLNRN